jgi:hypothetical protein
VEASRIKQAMDEGAVVEGARPIADYWAKRNVADLLLMVANRPDTGNGAAPVVDMGAYEAFYTLYLSLIFR